MTGRYLKTVIDFNTPLMMHWSLSASPSAMGSGEARSNALCGRKLMYLCCVVCMCIRAE